MHPLVHSTVQHVPFPVINMVTAIAMGPREAILLPCGGKMLEGTYVILGLGRIWCGHEV